MTDQTPDKKPPLTPLRWFFTSVGGLFMLFGGGFTLLIAALDLPYEPSLLNLFLILGAAPLLIGGLILWAAVKWRRWSAG